MGTDLAARARIILCRRGDSQRTGAANRRRGAIIRPNAWKGQVALKVKVRLFASYREKVGRSEVELDLPQGSTVGSLVGRMTDRYSDLSQRPDTLVVAVNHEYRDHMFELDDGDEVALIPPVSGGSRD